MKFKMEWTSKALVIITLILSISCTGGSCADSAAENEGGIPMSYNASMDGNSVELPEQATANSSTALEDLLTRLQNSWKPIQEGVSRDSDLNMEEIMRGLAQEAKMLAGIWAVQNVSSTCLDHMQRYLDDFSNSVTYARQSKYLLFPINLKYIYLKQYTYIILYIYNYELCHMVIKTYGQYLQLFTENDGGLKTHFLSTFLFA